MDGKLRNMTSIYILKDQKVLLLYRQGSRVVNNVWMGSAGGHFENSELNDARTCVIRELKEELGMHPEDIDGLSLRYITLRRINGEIRQNYYFFAELKQSANDDLHSNEGICKWFSTDELGTLEMPFTARYVTEHYFREGKMTDNLYAGIVTAEGVDFFSLPET